MVENTIYPISHGDIIISRPNEYHHCIQHSTKNHTHFWILFSSDGNEELFDLFFKREKGTKNLIVLSEDNKEALIKLCMNMAKNHNDDIFSAYLNFFDLINLIKGGQPKSYDNSGYIPFELQKALDIINQNFTQVLSIKDIAEETHVSINTMERTFKKYLGMTPCEYIKRKRLSHACLLLQDKNSVYDASVKSGFSDYSHFIQVFKNTFGETPLSYKNQFTKK